MKRRTFNYEFKLEAVKLVTERGVAVVQACRDLELSESVLRRWMRGVGDAPLEAFPGHGRASQEQAEVVALAQGTIIDHCAAKLREWQTKPKQNALF